MIDNDYLNSKRDIDLAVEYNVTPIYINKSIPQFYLYQFYEIPEIDYSHIPNGFKKFTH